MVGSTSVACSNCVVSMPRLAIDGPLMKWTETEYLKGDDAVLGGLYVAHFMADNKIAGDWMDPKHTITPKGPRYGTRGADFVLKKE